VTQVTRNSLRTRPFLFAPETAWRRNIVKSFIKHVCGCLAGAAVLSLVVAAPARADTPTGQAPTVEVHYGSLDLSTPEGQAKLRTRVKRAAMEVCEYDGVLRDLNHLAYQRTCVKKALASADVQIAAVLGRADIRTKLAAGDLPLRY
jgi:UrcA family protein